MHAVTETCPRLLSCFSSLHFSLYAEMAERDCPAFLHIKADIGSAAGQVLVTGGR